MLKLKNLILIFFLFTIKPSIASYQTKKEIEEEELSEKEEKKTTITQKIETILVWGGMLALIYKIFPYNYLSKLFEKEFKISEKTKKLTPKDIINELSKYVVGQEHTKETFAITGYMHIQRTLARMKDKNICFPKLHPLIIGPSSSGKTLCAKSLAKVLGGDFNAPILNCATATATGFVGGSVGSKIADKLKGVPRKRAEYSIVIFDETDKLASKHSPNGRDICGTEVQNELLKIIDGDIVYETGKNGYPGNSLKTHNMTFIFLGVFDGLTSLTPKSLVRFGMKREFVNRLHLPSKKLHPLSSDNMLDMLNKTEDSILKQYQNLFAQKNTTISFTGEALNFLAKKCSGSKTGARVQTVFSNVLRNFIINIPSDGNIVITEEHAKKYYK